MEKSISFLLGAGFSAPMGYPVGIDLSNSLLTCTGDDFSFSPDGRLTTSISGKKPDFGFKTDYDFQFDFCQELMLYFKDTKAHFDYEEFYDFLKQEAKSDPKVKDLFNSKKYRGQKDLGQMLSSMENIYSQLVSRFLVDGKKESWYENAAHMGGSWWPGYTGILDYFKSLQSDYLINVHTLNND